MRDISAEQFRMTRHRAGQVGLGNEGISALAFFSAVSAHSIPAPAFRWANSNVRYDPLFGEAWITAPKAGFG